MFLFGLKGFFRVFSKQNTFFWRGDKNSGNCKDAFLVLSKNVCFVDLHCVYACGRSIFSTRFLNKAWRIILLELVRYMTS